MEMKPDTSSVLMSEVLKGQIPDLEEVEVVDALAGGKHVIVILEKLVSTTATTAVGILRGMLFDTDPEVELRIDLTEALDIVEAKSLLIGKLELHHGERIVPVIGPFKVKAKRLDEVSFADQLCTLGLHLTRYSP